MDASTPQFGHHMSTVVVPKVRSPTSHTYISNKETILDTIKNTTMVNDQSSSDPGFARFDESSNDTHMQICVMANGASTRPKSLAGVEVITDKGVSASAITRFPMEVIARIIKWSVTPISGKFEMPGLTTAVYKPGVNTKILLINRAFYHEARRWLLHNIFVISDYGSDLQRLASSSSLTRCRLDGCVCNTPVLHTLVLNVGDTWAMSRFAEGKMYAFACALKYLRKPLQVKTLFINFKQACFVSPQADADTVLRWFSECLVNIKVSKFFVLQGLDIHLYLDIRQFAKKLGMKSQPITSTFHPRYLLEHENGFVQMVEGRYACVYVPATMTSEIDEQPGQTIDDAKAAFLVYKNTEQGIDVYPW